MSPGSGGETLPPPQAVAASTTQPDQSFMAPPPSGPQKATTQSPETTEPPGSTRRLFVTSLSRRRLFRAFPPQHAVLPAVAEVDPEPDHEPHEQPDPCVQGERQHETDTRKDAEQRDERHERRA